MIQLFREAVCMTETRKIAAILAADVVGYSRLAGADERSYAGPASGTPKRSDRSDYRGA